MGNFPARAVSRTFFRAHFLHYKKNTKRLTMDKFTGVTKLQWPVMSLNFKLYIWIRTGIIGDLKIPPSLWISRLLVELQSSSKNKKNPHGLLIGGGIKFQSSIYHSFPLKPGCIKKSKQFDFKKSSANVWKSDENLRATFNEAPIKTSPFQLFQCRVDLYLVIVILVV